MPQKPGRRFLNRSAGNPRTYSYRPLRELPEVADDAETVARIAEARDIRDEPEAPSGHWIDAEADLRRTYDYQRHLLEVAQAEQMRKLLDAESRLAEVKRRAKMRHINISNEVHAVSEMLERAKKGGRRTPPAAVTRIERMESRLDYRPDLAA